MDMIYKITYYIFEKNNTLIDKLNFWFIFLDLT